MDQQIQKALEKCVNAYGATVRVDVSEIWALLVDAFSSDSPFLAKVEQMDAVFDDHPRFEELREVV